MLELTKGVEVPENTYGAGWKLDFQCDVDAGQRVNGPWADPFFRSGSGNFTCKQDDPFSVTSTGIPIPGLNSPMWQAHSHPCVTWQDLVANGELINTYMHHCW